MRAVFRRVSEGAGVLGFLEHQGVRTEGVEEGCEQMKHDSTYDDTQKETSIFYARATQHAI